jgi:hypothetical protein
MQLPEVLGDEATNNTCRCQRAKCEVEHLRMLMLKEHTGTTAGIRNAVGVRLILPAQKPCQQKLCFQFLMPLWAKTFRANESALDQRIALTEDVSKSS